MKKFSRSKKYQNPALRYAQTRRYYDRVGDRFIMWCQTKLHGQSRNLSNIKKLLLSKKVQVTAAFAVAVLLFSYFAPWLPEKQKASALSQGPRSATSTSDCSSVVGPGTVSWTGSGNALSSNNSRATANINGTTTRYLRCDTFGFSIPANATVVGVVAGVERSVNSVSEVTTDSEVLLVKGGVIGGLNRATATPWTATDTYEDHGGVSDLWGNTLSPSDVNSDGFGVAVSATKTAGTTRTAQIDHIRLTVYYETQANLNQMGYLWENDDEDQAVGDAYDSNSAQATVNTAITGVRHGERLTLRTQIKNTGIATLNNEVGLFYDKNSDGNFIRANFPEPRPTAGGACTDTGWTCSDIDTSMNGSLGSAVSVAISPVDGKKYVAFTDAAQDLKIAEYVGVGGNGCTGSTAWTCTLVDNTGTTSYVSLAVSSTGIPQIAFARSDTDDLRFALYVGTGGTGCGGANPAWTCTAVHVTPTVDPNSNISLALVNTTPYISYSLGGSDDDLYVARYVGGSSGTGCTGGSTAWTCTPVKTDNSGGYSAIAVSPSGVPYVSYQHNATADLYVAHFVGAGGNCATGGGSAEWQCDLVDDTIQIAGYETSISFDPAGNPWVSYLVTSGFTIFSGNSLRVARYVGSGGSGCAASATAWSCGSVDLAEHGVNRKTPEIVFGPSGSAYVVYHNQNTSSYKVARYVGNGGNGCSASSAWTCFNLFTGGTVGISARGQISLAFDHKGLPNIAFFDPSGNDLSFATPNIGGEISLATPLAGAHGDPLNTPKVTGGCIGGGSWSNGRLFTTNLTSNLGLSQNNCTEVAFVIDTSQADAGATYRFIIASADNFRPDESRWRGPVAIVQYPTLTLANNTTLKAAKGSEITMPNACNITGWSCMNNIDNTIAGSQIMAMTLDKYGNPFMIYREPVNNEVSYARYVGTGGTGCASGTTLWTCGLLDTEATIRIAMATSPSGQIYAAYYNQARTIIAQYVGTGGTGCSSAAWNCIDLFSSDPVGTPSIGFTSSGTPYVTFYIGPLTRALFVATYDGDSVASGCMHPAWTCTEITSVGNSIELSAAQNSTEMPFITYISGSTSGTLFTAQYVGSGGSGCTLTTAWTCVAIHTISGSVGPPSLAFNASGVPHIIFRDGSMLYMAHYVGSSGSCTDPAWQCTQILSSGAATTTGSLTFGADDVPHIVHRTNVGMKLLKFVGSGGNCSNLAWSCDDLVLSTDDVTPSEIHVGPGGSLNVAYTMNLATDTIGFAKLALPDIKPISTARILNPGRNGLSAFGQYRLTDGRSPRSGEFGLCGSAVAGNLGYCGIYNDGGAVESITAQANERPYFNFSQLADTNTDLPTAHWIGRSNIAPSTAGNGGNIVLQVYRFGTTNAWETVGTDSTSSDCNTVNCRIVTIPSGPVGQYFESDGAGKYWMHWRLWQYENPSGAETLSTDMFRLQFPGKQMRHGKVFENNVRRVDLR